MHRNNSTLSRDQVEAIYGDQAASDRASWRAFWIIFLVLGACLSLAPLVEAVLP